MQRVVHFRSPQDTAGKQHLFVTVASNCTDRFQPLDLAVNKPAKDFVRAHGSSIGMEMKYASNLKRE